MSLLNSRWLHFGAMFVVLAFLTIAAMPEAMAYVPSKLEVDLGTLVNEQDSLDKKLGSFIGWAVMLGAMLLGAATLGSMAYGGFVIINRMMDENDRGFGIKEAVIQLIMIVIIGLFVMVIAYILFDIGTGIRSGK